MACLAMSRWTSSRSTIPHVDKFIDKVALALPTLWLGRGAAKQGKPPCSAAPLPAARGMAATADMLVQLGPMYNYHAH